MSLFRKKVDISQVSYRLAKSLETQRTLWLDACLNTIIKIDSNNADYHLNNKTDVIVKAFQVVHVLAFIYERKYLSPKDLKQFFNQLCTTIFGTELEDAFPFIKRYDELQTKNMGEDFYKQFLIFAEDIALSITDSPKGMLYASVIDSITIEFYKKNLKLVALAFNDMETAGKIWQKPQ